MTICLRTPFSPQPTIPFPREEGKAKRCFLLPPLRSTSLYLGFSPSFCSIFPSTFQPAAPKKSEILRHTVNRWIFTIAALWSSLGGQVIESVRPYFLFRPNNTPISSIVKNSSIVLTSKKFLKLGFPLSGTLPYKKHKRVFSN